MGRDEESIGQHENRIVIELVKILIINISSEFSFTIHSSIHHTFFYDEDSTFLDEWVKDEEIIG